MIQIAEITNYAKLLTIIISHNSKSFRQWRCPSVCRSRRPHNSQGGRAADATKGVTDFLRL